ncbi:hypothetical protein A0J48_005160 [Sphaerospermopsis aphanizomenoides BCCUSP55]|uniref:hypothetical protein n=1 Tax=Sphaerospermopsis aphanizomenoides TaxID=459663 RepID=UPI001906C040|nr:hypothetical protein [Sphaerospermopsis aphanizomenoides]MBK1986936.1 hypothetical protein [Sphaerospermopsis aphanizomenoides BCCUSP55]
MQLFRFASLVLVIVVNLIIALPSWAETPSSSNSNPDYFQVGQKVIWLYKSRADSSDIQRITVEIVKLGSKQIQIKVPLRKNEFCHRWVNRSKLENFHSLKD